MHAPDVPQLTTLRAHAILHFHRSHVIFARDDAPGPAPSTPSTSIVDLVEDSSVPSVPNVFALPGAAPGRLVYPPTRP